MRKIYFALILILLLVSIFILRNFLSKVGLVVNTINVSIQEKLIGKLLLAFKPYLEIGETQQITTEFINIGTKPVTEKIEIRVSGYINGTLRPLAYYYDVYVPLNPGMRRSYSTIFLPPNIGLYYIQARSYYDTRVVEAWGAFSVYSPPPQIIPVYPPAAAPAAPPAPVLGIPDLSLEYPSGAKFYRGEKRLLNITVKNIGTAALHNLKLYMSMSSLINVEIYPKQVSALGLNQSVVFVVSIEVPESVEVGIYPLEFEVWNDEGAKKRGEIAIEVVSVAPPEEEEIYSKILNYEFLILEIQGEINSAFSEGYDVALANQTLNYARLSLENVKDYFRLKKIAEAKKELTKVEKYIEDAALQLASATLYLYRPPALLWWLILLLIILIASAFLAYWYLRRRGKKPKLLQKLEEETEK
ncbi:MAG: hypothetical protein QXU74_02085 [Candidatus Aenigmatarchaeota archaeon]